MCYQCWTLPCHVICKSCITSIHPCTPYSLWIFRIPPSLAPTSALSFDNLLIYFARDSPHELSIYLQYSRSSLFHLGTSVRYYMNWFVRRIFGASCFVGYLLIQQFVPQSETNDVNALSVFWSVLPILCYMVPWLLLVLFGVTWYMSHLIYSFFQTISWVVA